MKKTLLTGTLLLWAAMLFSQNFLVEAGSGIGFYKMKNMKALNTYVMKDMSLKAKLTDDFPSWVYFKGAVLYGIPDYTVGLAISRHSTGSRISAMDYSGIYHFDNIINAWMPGVFVRFPLTRIGSFELEGQLETGVILSKVRTNEYLKLYDTVFLDNKFIFNSLNNYIEPVLKISYPVYNVKISCQISYMAQYGKQGFKVDQQGNTQVLNPGTNTALKPEWDGLRLNLSVLYALDKLFKPSKREKRGKG